MDSIMAKIPKMNGVLRGNCCETCRNIPHKNTYEGVHQEEFSNKTDAFSKCLHNLFINKRNNRWSCNRFSICFI